MQQRRFVLALLLSAVILFGWGYLQRRFFPAPAQSNANNSTAQQPSPAPSTPGPQTTQNEQQAPQTVAAASSTQDTTPQRTVLIKTPLYEVKLNNTGGVATSWILKSLPPENGSARALYSVGGDKDHPQPLELIPQEGVKRGQSPFQLFVGDQNLDSLLANRNYQIKGAESAGGEINLELGPGNPQQTVEFVLQDSATGINVTKAITFYADRYISDIEVKVSRNGQSIPQAKILIGPSIGDQGVKHYSFYSVAPEAIAVVGEKDERHLAEQLNHKNGDHLAVNGPVDWAGVGDTYFAMIAAPAQRTEGLELRTTQFDYQANGKSESRYLISALVPIPADGSRNRIYTGPKDHYMLTAASQEISGSLNPARPVDLERSIDYGFLGSISRPLAVPILWSIKKLYHLIGSMCIMYGSGADRSGIQRKCA